MAQLIIAAAGAAIGGALVPGVIGLGITGASAGWTIGSLIGSAFAPAQKSQGPRLNDLSVSSSAYGTPIPYVQGSPRIAGQIVWASTKREIATTTRQGGKGGGKQKVTTYTYEVDLLILLTDNIIPGITRIWSNGKLIWNKSLTADAATIAASDSTPAWTRITAYTGSASQLPDPTYEAAVGTANAPAYRGRGSVFIQGLQLGSSGQIPNLTFEIGSTLSAVVPSAELSLGGGVGSVQVVTLDDTYAMVAYTAGGSGGYVRLIDISGATPVSLYSANLLSAGDAIGTFTRIDSTRALIMLKLGIDARACMMVIGRIGSTLNWGARVVAPVGVAVFASGDQYANTSKLDATRFLTCYKNGNFLASYVTTVDASALTVTNVGANYNSGSYAPFLYARGVAVSGSAGVGMVTKQPFSNEIDPVPLTIAGDVVTYGTLGAYIDTTADAVLLEPLPTGNAFCGYQLFTGDGNAAVSNGSGGSFLRTVNDPYRWNSASFGALGGYAGILNASTSDLYALTLSLSGAAVGALALISAGSTLSDMAVAPGGAGVVVYTRSGAGYVRKLVMA
jgi:hypothetical protein